MGERDVEIGSADYRRVMGHFCTGVVVVTAEVDGQPLGMTCQSFVSVSLDPPLVLFCPAHSSTSWPEMSRAGKFCVNVLADDQRAISERFAVSGGNKFQDVAWSPSEHGSPRLDGCLAHVDCTIESVHEAGDHDIVVGRVRDLVVSRSTSPLLFFQGRFASLSS